MAELMTVRVRDRATEKATWGSGWRGPIVRAVTIAADCPVCGGPRGEPRNHNESEDGEHYAVDVWENPCGHVDLYTDVLREAATLGAPTLVAPATSRTPPMPSEPLWDESALKAAREAGHAAYHAHSDACGCRTVGHLSHAISDAAVAAYFAALDRRGLHALAMSAALDPVDGDLVRADKTAEAILVALGLIPTEGGDDAR